MERIPTNLSTAPLRNIAADSPGDQIAASATDNTERPCGCSPWRSMEHAAQRRPIIGRRSHDRCSGHSPGYGFPSRASRECRLQQTPTLCARLVTAECKSCLHSHDERQPELGWQDYRENDLRRDRQRRGPASSRHATRSSRWDISEGLAEVGEDIPNTAARELFEEPGLTAQIGDLRSLGLHDHVPSNALGSSTNSTIPYRIPARLRETER